MKISVIIPAFNGGKWLVQCLEGVLCQTYKNLEIIVVNDGSTDDTAAIAARYPNVKLISQENQGLSVSRNRGVEAATGEYIHFLDVDDILCIDYYARMAETIKHTGADMAIGGVVNEVQPGLSLCFSERLLLVTLEDKISLANSGIMVCACRYLIRRSFVLEAGLSFRPGRLMEDVEYSLEAIRLSGKVATVPGATYYYMPRNGSITYSQNREHKLKLGEHRKMAIAFINDFFERHGLGDHIVPTRKFGYKIFGIPMLEKIEHNIGKTKWYLFGLRICQRRPLRM